MDIQRYLKTKKKAIDSNLLKYLPSSKETGIIVEAMKYSLVASGKRFRPILLIAACEAVGGSPDQALPIACAFEYIHVFSLIHDDLPAMDNADYRRGQLSNHKKFGEAISILAGDALNTLAFEVISRQKKLPPALRLKLIEELSTSLGVKGVVGGQVLDIKSENKKVDLISLKKIHSRKTGALIRAAVVAGGIIGGASPSQLKTLSQFAEHLGVEFQIIDDIMDITGSFEKTGKVAGVDVQQGKSTYPAIFGLSRSLELAKEEAKASLKCLEGFGPRAEILREIVRFVLEREV